MSRIVLALAASLVVTALVGCASGDKKPDAAPAASTESSAPPAAAAPAPGSVDAEVLKAVASQLNCAPEKVTLTCTERDRTGECIAVSGKGCGNEVNYKYGTE